MQTQKWNNCLAENSTLSKNLEATDFKVVVSESSERNNDKYECWSLNTINDIDCFSENYKDIYL